MQLTYRTGYATLDTRQDVQTVLESGGMSLQQAKLPPAYNAILSIRSTDSVATFSIDGGHTLAPGDLVDLYWVDGVRTQGQVDSVDGELAIVDFGVVPVSFGCHTLPAQDTACILDKLVDLQLQNIPPTGWDTLIFTAGARCLFTLLIAEAGEDDQFVHVYCPSPGVFIYGPTAARISTPAAPVQSSSDVLPRLIPSNWRLVQARMSHAGNNQQLSHYTHGLACLIDGGAVAQVTVPSVAPTFSPVAGSYDAIQNITLATVTPEALIYYTTNGDTPTTASTPYTAPFEISESQTVKAIAVKTGQPHSAVSTAVYVIELLPEADPPLFIVEPGLGGSVNVTVTTPPNNYTDGDVIYRVAWGATEGSTNLGSATFSSDPVGDNSMCSVAGLTPAQGYWFTVRVDSFSGGSPVATAPSEYGESLPCVAAFETPDLSGPSILNMSDEGSPATFYLDTLRTAVFSNDDFYIVSLVSTEEAPAEFFTDPAVPATGTQQQVGGTNAHEVSEEFEYYAVATYVRVFAGLEFLASQPSTTANITMP